MPRLIVHGQLNDQDINHVNNDNKVHYRGESVVNKNKVYISMSYRA
jgi:hypothetical protein